MAMYGEWALIDSVVKNSNYTHNEVFELSWAEVMQMVAYNRHVSYLEARSQEIKHDAEKSVK